MAKMILGTYTFDDNPSEVSDLITPVRHTANIKTYSSIAFFSWGTSMLGKEITLKWLGMTTEQYEIHESQLVDDTYLTFNPQDGNGLTFTVEMTGLRGGFHMYSDGEYRINVEMDLLFISEGA